jgi:hypothetical protein
MLADSPVNNNYINAGADTSRVSSRATARHSRLGTEPTSGGPHAPAPTIRLPDAGRENGDKNCASITIGDPLIVRDRESSQRQLCAGVARTSEARSRLRGC